MRNLLKISIFLTGVFVLTFSFSQSSYAQCVVTGITPGGGEVVVCTGTDPNGITTTNNPDDVTVQPGADISRSVDNVIDTLDGDDMVQINGGTITAFDAIGVALGQGNNVVHMTAGTIIAQEEGIRPEDGNDKITIDGGLIDASMGNQEGIDTRLGNDEVTVNAGEIIGADAGIQTGGGDDTVIITGGRVVQVDTSDQTIDTGTENDLISVSNAIIDGINADNGEAIDAGNENDTVRLGTGAVILGITSGGDDFDTLVFEMEVPGGLINRICGDILTQDPDEGSITINDLFYEWEEFELLVCDLQPLQIVRPVPTISQWGMIATAGVLGLMGLFALRRKNAAV